ncbi:unnamed protein product [Closterium sp. NIES-64]|nr:unnamed protein product [Closterium sp. NIES-64]
MTDKNGHPQANVFLVNDSGAVFKDSVDCRMETKTGGYVASILRPVVEEVRPENVVVFCTGGGSNYAVACNELIAEWPHIQHVPCGTHVMDPYMEDVGKMPWAKKEVDPAGEKISFVRNHHWTRGYLRTPEMVGVTMLQALKLVGTRFGTQYIVVSRLCELRESLAQMVVSDVWKGWAVGERKKSAEKFAALVLDAVWWRTVEFFCKQMNLLFISQPQLMSLSLHRLTATPFTRSCNPPSFTFSALILPPSPFQPLPLHLSLLLRAMQAGS